MFRYEFYRAQGRVVDRRSEVDLDFIMVGRGFDMREGLAQSQRNVMLASHKSVDDRSECGESPFGINAEVGQVRFCGQNEETSEILFLY